jgi:hypothetical protein
MEESTEPNEGTRDAERSDAGRSHQADRPPTEQEVADADRARSDETPEDLKSVAEHYEEMAELGANAKGEGKID